LAGALAIPLATPVPLAMLLMTAKSNMHLSDAQREKLCEMTNFAFREIRQLAEAGKLEQAFDLAAAFHYLLDDMWGDEFSLVNFREEVLAGYQEKYPEPATRNYVALVDRIIALGNQDSSAN
jgi:hypothetical protein